MEKTKKLTKTAKELGFIPNYISMTPEQTNQFASILLTTDKDLEDKAKEIELPFNIQILDKRVEVMNLPIKFTLKAKLLIFILSGGNPGKAVIILIDCLTRYEGKTVSDNKVINLYPMGFYNETSFINYVDNYLKTRKCKWSEIY